MPASNCWLESSSWLNVILSNWNINNSMDNAVNCLVCDSIHRFNAHWISNCSKHLRFLVLRQMWINIHTARMNIRTVHSRRPLKCLLVFCYFHSCSFSLLLFIYWKLHPLYLRQLNKSRNKHRTFATCSNVNKLPQWIFHASKFVSFIRYTKSNYILSIHCVGFCLSLLYIWFFFRKYLVAIFFQWVFFSIVYYSAQDMIEEFIFYIFLTFLHMHWRML